MFQITVGVDIAKKKFDVALLMESKYKHKLFTNDEAGFEAFIVWLLTFNLLSRPLICMEATGAYSQPLADLLVAKGYPISVVNPAKVKAFAQSELSRAKTDKADAKLIARYALSMQPGLWTPPPPAIRRLQALTRRIEHLLEIQQMERNRLDTADESITASINSLLKTVEDEIKTIRLAINDLINDNPDLDNRRKLLESIPGIGSATIAHLLIALSSHQGFTNAKQVVAFAGLAPYLRESDLGQVKPASPKAAIRSCARRYICPRCAPGNIIRSFMISANASKPMARTARPLSVPPCASLFTSLLVSLNPASLSILFGQSEISLDFGF